MKDTRKKSQWRDILIVQASIGALFLPIVISLAIVASLAGHGDEARPAVDKFVTSATR
jgi:hypothetical protein